MRDQSAVELALACPPNLVAHGVPDAAPLAAADAFGLARNHAFLDGNKRTAFVVSTFVLAHNGFHLTATDAEAILTFVALAAGDVSEDALADWFRNNMIAA